MKRAHDACYDGNMNRAQPFAFAMAFASRCIGAALAAPGGTARVFTFTKITTKTT